MNTREKRPRMALTGLVALVASSAGCFVDEQAPTAFAVVHVPVDGVGTDTTPLTGARDLDRTPLWARVRFVYADAETDPVVVTFPPEDERTPAPVAAGGSITFEATLPVGRLQRAEALVFRRGPNNAADGFVGSSPFEASVVEGAAIEVGVDATFVASGALSGRSVPQLTGARVTAVAVSDVETGVVLARTTPDLAGAFLFAELPSGRALQLGLEATGAAGGALTCTAQALEAPLLAGQTASVVLAAGLCGAP